MTMNMNTAVQSSTQIKQTGQTHKRNFNEIIFSVGIILTLTILVQLTTNYLYLDKIAVSIAGKETTLAGLKTENQRLTNIEANHTKLLVDAAKAENDYRQLQSLIPQKAELPKVLDWVSEQAYSRGLKLESFEKTRLQQNLQQKISELEHVSIKAIVSGDQSQIVKLLIDFSRHERVLLVESVKISEKEKNKDFTEVISHKGEIIFSAFLGTDNGKLKPKQ